MRGDDKNGPNDMSHVVWALGMSFKILYILTDDSWFYLSFECMRSDWVCGD